MPNFNLWLHNDTDSEATLQRAAREGTVLLPPKGAKMPPFTDWLAMTWPADAALGYRLHLFLDRARKALEVRTGNPVAPFGPPQQVWIERVEPDEQSGEAMVHFRLGGADGLLLAYFDPAYCHTHQLYRQRAPLDVRFAGLAFRAERLRETTFEIREGPLLDWRREQALEEDPDADVASITSVTADLHDLRCYLPADEPQWADSGSFQTMVEEPELLAGPVDAEIWKWNGTYITEQETWPALSFPTYICAARLSDPLEAGIPLRGRLWLHGTPASTP